MQDAEPWVLKGSLISGVPRAPEGTTSVLYSAAINVRDLDKAAAEALRLHAAL